ncbi:MAG: hypothetical protein WBF68_07255 [Atribacterota bacterium]
MKKPKILLIFSHLPKGIMTWPRIDYDYEKKIKEILKNLNKKLQNLDFIATVVHNTKEAEGILSEHDKVDGIVNYIIGIWTGAPNVIARSGKPVVLVNDVIGGSGEFLTTYASARNEGFPVIGTASSNFEDIVKLIKLFRVKKRFSEAKILVISDIPWERRRKEMKYVFPHAEELFGPLVRNLDIQADRIKELFGIKILGISYEELHNIYKVVSDIIAENIADNWIGEALRVVEPTREEIIKSAKMYLAINKVMTAKEADAVTIDCYGQISKVADKEPNIGKLDAFPCLALFQLNNEGKTAVCEVDLSSSLTQLLVRFLAEENTGRSLPGFVNDPIIDTSLGRIIYAHCTAPNKAFSPIGPKNPYIIRSHAEARQGASIQSLMPVGEKITVAQLHFLDKPTIVIHQGKTVSNEDIEEGCRTKIAAKVNANRIMENWNLNIKNFAAPAYWHRNLFFGDWKEQLINLATLIGLNVIEEDK